MKVSVLIPAYNCQDTIYNCIRSIRKQTYENIEIIVVDDGSTDETSRRLDNYEKYFKNKLKVIHNSHQGVAETRNIAIDYATGEYIFFVDADDWINEHTIEKMVNKAIEHNADVVICGNDLNVGVKRKNNIKSELAPNRRMVLKYLLQDNKVRNFSWGKLYKKSSWKGITFPKGRIFEDVATIHKILIESKKTLIIPDTFYHYNTNRKNSITYSLRTNILTDMMYAFTIQAKDICEFDPTLEKECKHMMLRNRIIAIISLIRHGDLNKEIINKIFLKNKVKKYDANLLRNSDLLNKTQ